MTQTVSKPTAKATVPPAPPPTMLIEVSAISDSKQGSTVYDGFDRFFPIEQAARFDPRIRQQAMVSRPQLSGEKHPTEQDATLMERYEGQLASIPKLWPIRRVHGQSFRDPGFYAVSGPKVLDATHVVQRDRDGHWRDAPGTTWDGPYLTIEEARAAHNLPELPKAPHQPKLENPVLRAVREENRELRRKLAEAEVAAGGERLP